MVCKLAGHWFRSAWSSRCTFIMFHWLVSAVMQKNRTKLDPKRLIDMGVFSKVSSVAQSPRKTAPVCKIIC